MNARIVNYRVSRHLQKDNYMVLKVDGVTNREAAAKLVGKTVSWETATKKKIAGKITAAHGNSGAVRALFEKGMPGQSVSTEVSVN